MFKHMNDNLRYAKLKVYGEEFNPLGDENAQVIESIFEEGNVNMQIMVTMIGDRNATCASTM